MSGISVGCHNWGKSTSSGVEAIDAAKHPTGYKTASSQLNKAFFSKNVSVEAGKT